MDLNTFCEATDALVASDPSLYCDGESIVALQRQLARLECFVTKAVGEFDTWGQWGNDGAKTAGAWVATRTHLPRARANRVVRRAGALRHLPECARAWSEGSITSAHVDAVMAVRRPTTEDALARDEALLVAQAQELTFAHFYSALAYWEQMADPAGAQESDMERRARRSVFLTRSMADMYLGQMTLDPISGAIVSTELERLERQLFEEDWAKAKAELGKEPKVTELWRTSAQRRADALVEMATRSRSTGPGAQRPEPLFTVLVGYESLYGPICEIEGGAVLSAHTALDWLNGAIFERVVFAPGVRIECSSKARFFAGATRRAIELRDRECTHEFCEVPAERCQADHIIPYSHDGPTTQENGQMLCAFHNGLKNGREPPGD